MSLLSRRDVLFKTVYIGISTLASRFLGLARERLQLIFLGVGPISDAFITAFRIPNSLRKIFAEGVLSASFIPTFIKVQHKEGTDEAFRLLSTVFLLMQTLIIALCCLVVYHAEPIMYLLVPGWAQQTNIHAEQFVYALLFLKILIFYIVFISASSLLAGALQGLHHYTVPAWSQAFLNVLWIGELALCIYFDLPIIVIVFSALLNGFLLVLVHLYAYKRCMNGKWLLPTRKTWRYVYEVLQKFLPSLISVGAIEINIFIDQSLASYLPYGSVTLLHYAWALVRIPIGVFAVAFSTILLPQITRLHTKNPKRVSFYLFEAIKLIICVTLPAMGLMILFSFDVINTFFGFDPRHLHLVMVAQKLLIAYASGLFFFCLNKILLSVLYGLHENKTSAFISLLSAFLNTAIIWFLLDIVGIVIIPVATVIACVVQTGLFLWILHKRFGINVSYHKLIIFIRRLLLSYMPTVLLGLVLYRVAFLIILGLPATTLKTSLLYGYAYWLWVAPVCGLTALVWFVSRHFFKIKLYFID